MSEETKGPFYNQGEQDPQETGRINPPEAAHELAHVQAEQGMNAMDRREGELKRQHEDGKTDDERNYIKLMDLLKEKYPHSFIEMTDEKGRKLLLLKPGYNLGRLSSRVTGDYLIYTEYGPVAFGTERRNDLNTLLEKGQLDLTTLVDFVQRGKVNQITNVTIKANIPGEKEPFEFPVGIFTPDLLIESNREELRSLHTIAEDNEAGKLAVAEELKKTIQAEEMIQNL